MEKARVDESDPRVRQWAPVCQALALLLSPYAQVVLHDVADDRVLGIWNPMTRRTAGDPSLLGELDGLDPSAHDVYGPYEKPLADGRRLSSVSRRDRPATAQRRGATNRLCTPRPMGPRSSCRAVSAMPTP
ncbi:PAS domain-containing protein [Actinacidiphila glaucinigra]|uniref:PAS domain-containing protein n=1 Tax=Actinacidiphila glaucinigra TaxID=235986 RepID=UPI002E302E7E|nr:PAS domain-containing protein [Actinacidiphila glaucinigra]